MNILKKIWTYLISRYTKLQLIIFVVIIFLGFFITDSSIFARFSYDAQIMDLNSQINYYKKQAIKDRKQLEEIRDDRYHVEKFARENYKMKKANEDIFVEQ